MNYSQIEAFLDLVETKNYSRTAQRLSVSQPAITQRIGALEKYVGTALFKRSGDDLQLTAAGVYLYRQGKQIANIWHTTQLKLQEFIDNVPVVITLGASTIPAQFFISPLIKNFQEFYPHIKIHVKVAGTNQVVQWLRQREIDVAIVGSAPEDDHSFVAAAVARDELYLIVPASHNWADKAYIEVNDLADAPFISREIASGTRRLMENSLFAAGFDPDLLNSVGEFGSTEAVISAVECGLGVAFVSKLAAERSLALAKVKIVTVKNFSAKRNLYLISDKLQPSLAVNQLLEFIKKTCFQDGA